MDEQGVIEFTNAFTGGVGLRGQDGSYVLVEQVDVKPLKVGQVLRGRMDSVGVEYFTDSQSDERYEVFVQAFGLSLDAVRNELL